MCLHFQHVVIVPVFPSRFDSISVHRRFVIALRSADMSMNLYVMCDTPKIMCVGIFQYEIFQLFSSFTLFTLFLCLFSFFLAFTIRWCVNLLRFWCAHTNTMTYWTLRSRKTTHTILLFFLFSLSVMDMRLVYFLFIIKRQLGWNVNTSEITGLIYLSN